MLNADFAFTSQKMDDVTGAPASTVANDDCAKYCSGPPGRALTYLVGQTYTSWKARLSAGACSRRSDMPFSLAVDLDRLENEYDLQRVRLLVVDPVSAYLGPAKSTNHGADVRTVLGRFATFAAQHNLRGLAISHLNKTSGARAITRIMGSLEWVAAPRAVFLVTEEAGTDRRLFLPLKNNLASNRFGYAFRIEDRVVAHDIKTSAVVWDHRTSYDHRRRGPSRRSQEADVRSDRFPRAGAQRRSG